MPAALDAPPLLPEQETARARAHAYTLFQRLFLEGLTGELLPYARAIPALAQALGPVGEAGAFDPDGAAADHYQLLVYNVYPYESAFLAAEASLGGAVTESVFAFYQELGLSGIGRSESPDHIGLELGCLAFLASAEADARQDGLPSQAARMQALQRRFLEEHLLGWLPGLVQAVRSQGSAFYTALAELALELALAHHGDLAAVAPARVFRLPPPPDLLSDEKTGVKEIAGYLLTTAWSGLYLSREDIARLARRRRLPRGFGDRQVMLTDLLRVAADYERLPEVLDDLGEQAGQWQQAYQAQRAAGPPLAHYAAAWLARLETTARLLERIRSAAG